MVIIYYGSRQNIDRVNLRSKEIALGSAADRVLFIFLTSARMCCATISDETLSYFLITLVERGLENHSLIYDSITSLEVSTQLDVECRQWNLTWYSMTFF